MLNRIDANALCGDFSNLPLVDARSEGEFAQGHIPGAVSLPLFNNEERAIIGTLYKREGRQAAIMRGLEITGPKMRALAEEGLRLARDNKIALHCWRGGMRSDSLAWLWQRIGLEVYVLSGGYKAYRKMCRGLFTAPWRLFILGGKTGTQKTALLGELSRAGHYTVDLEALANHRGSAFGSSQDGVQPTQEQFENALGHALFRCDLQKPLLVEDESRLIGRMHLPDDFWLRMRTSSVFVVERSLEERVAYLTRVYTAPKETMLRNLNAIAKRLGGDRYREASKALASNRVDEFCRIVLDYYDRAYAHGLGKRDASTLRYIPGENAFAEIVGQLSKNT